MGVSFPIEIEHSPAELVNIVLQDLALPGLSPASRLGVGGSVCRM